MNNIIKNLQARLEARKVEGEQGSLLLDVLIGMAIFALIALIAVSAVNGFRQRAYETAAISDTQGVALEIEANFTDAQTYPTAVTGASGAGYKYDGVAFDQKQSKNVEFLCYVKDANLGTYKVGLAHKTGTTVDAYAVFDSATGQVTHKRGAVGTLPGATTCA